MADRKVKPEDVVDPEVAVAPSPEPSPPAEPAAAPRYVVEDEQETDSVVVVDTRYVVERYPRAGDADVQRAEAQERADFLNTL